MCKRYGNRAGLLLFPEVFAYFGQAAFTAFGTPGSADIATMQNEPVVGCRENILGEIPDQFLFNAQWGSAAVWDKSNPVADTEYMRVNRHGLSPECDCHHYICCFAADSRKGRQVVNGCRYFAIELLQPFLPFWKCGRLLRWGMKCF